MAMADSQYGQVIFQDVRDMYGRDRDVECLYTPSLACPLTADDKVGICKVGSNAPFITEPASTNVFNVGQNPNSPNEYRVTFRAHQLPVDDGNFYQFCYISANAGVRGASMPFMFSANSLDDLVSVEDVENDLLVIKTRTSLLEDSLRQAARKNEELQKITKELGIRLTQEREKTAFQKEENQKVVAQLTKQRDDLEIALNKLQGKLDQASEQVKCLSVVKEDNSEMLGQNRAQLEKLETLKDELLQNQKLLELMRKNLKETQVENERLNESLRACVTEKAQLHADHVIEKDTMILQLTNFRMQFHALEKSKNLASSALNENLQKCSDLERELATMNDHVTSLRESERKHEQTANFVKADLKELVVKHNALLQNKADEAKAYQETIVKLTKANAELASALSVQETKASKLQTDHEQMAKKYEEVCKKLNHVFTRNEQMECAAKALEKKYSSLQENYDKLKMEHSKVFAKGDAAEQFPACDRSTSLSVSAGPSHSEAPVYPFPPYYPYPYQSPYPYYADYRCCSAPSSVVSGYGHPGVPACSNRTGSWCGSRVCQPKSPVINDFSAVTSPADSEAPSFSSCSGTAASSLGNDFSMVQDALNEWLAPTNSSQGSEKENKNNETPNLLLNETVAPVLVETVAHTPASPSDGLVQSVKDNHEDDLIPALQVFELNDAQAEVASVSSEPALPTDDLVPPTGSCLRSLSDADIAVLEQRSPGSETHGSSASLSMDRGIQTSDPPSNSVFNRVIQTLVNFNPIRIVDENVGEGSGQYVLTSPDDFSPTNASAPAAASLPLLTNCPVCDLTFGPEASAEMISSHVDDHCGCVCFMCHVNFGNNRENYQRHVMQHFD